MKRDRLTGVLDLRRLKSLLPYKQREDAAFRAMILLEAILVFSREIQARFLHETIGIATDLPGQRKSVP